MLELDPALLTGVDEIDRQHRELFTRVGALLDATRSRRSKEELEVLRQELATEGRAPCS